MAIEENFNIAFVAELARKERQIQQNYRPIFAVHKRFARRPGTLFRALTLSEFSDHPVTKTFFESNGRPGKKAADPSINAPQSKTLANIRAATPVSFAKVRPSAIAAPVHHVVKSTNIPAPKTVLRATAGSRLSISIPNVRKRLRAVFQNTG